ncbi:MAG: CapA family protein [Lachnospiraceae bacterium]
MIGATRVIPQTDWSAGVSHPGMLATYDPTSLPRKSENRNRRMIMYLSWCTGGLSVMSARRSIQRTLGKQYIDAGADLVIGSHPHALQGVEYYKEKAIVHSLGNFIFGVSIPRTALLEVRLPGIEKDATLGLPSHSRHLKIRVHADVYRRTFPSGVRFLYAGNFLWSSDRTGSKNLTN